MRNESTYLTTFEIQRGGLPFLRLEHDSRRHGPGEIFVTFFCPEERTQRMTVDELDQAIVEGRKAREEMSRG